MATAIRRFPHTENLCGQRVEFPMSYAVFRSVVLEATGRYHGCAS
jgi:hypothetical protein